MWTETCIDYQTIYDKRKYVNQSRWKTSIAAFQPLSIISGSSIMFYVHCIQIDVCKSANFKCTLCIRYLLCLNTELSGKITSITINVIALFFISSLICIFKYTLVCKTRTSVSEAKWMISFVDLGLCKTIRVWWLQVKKHKFAWECNFPGLKGFCEKWFYLKIFQLFLCWDISRKMLLNVI